jgi:hypothetical protein
MSERSWSIQMLSAFHARPDALNPLTAFFYSTPEAGSLDQGKHYALPASQGNPKPYKVNPDDNV